MKPIVWVTNIDNALFYSFINVSLHHKEDQPIEIIKLLTMYIMETSRVVVHQPVESACIVFNMDGFTLKNMVCITGCVRAFIIFCLGWGDQGTQNNKINRKGTSVTSNIKLYFSLFLGFRFR